MSVNQTLSYSDGVKGFPSFYSFLPDFMMGMNSYFYSFHQGNIWRHNTNDRRNSYYGVDYESTITGVFNVEPTSIKVFKTMSLESDSAWEVTNLVTDLNIGSMLDTYFEKKEGEYFSYIRSNSNTVDFKLRSANGLGLVQTSALLGGTLCRLTFKQPPGSILSQGDAIYAASTTAGVVTTDPQKAGVVTLIDNTPNTGVVTRATNPQGGLLYVAGSVLSTTVVTGSGDGNLTVFIGTVLPGGIIDVNQITVRNQGSGYEVGDTFTVDGPGTNVTGTVVEINAPSITIDISGGGFNPQPTAYILAYKNIVAESNGARGYFMEFKLKNTKTTPVELFSVGSSVMKSYP
tara:strand:- start:30859 stop:31896 length:1038 start_codon:yes stop_codon:yes gene_type:complete